MGVHELLESLFKIGPHAALPHSLEGDGNVQYDQAILALRLFVVLVCAIGVISGVSRRKLWHIVCVHFTLF